MVCFFRDPALPDKPTVFPPLVPEAEADEEESEEEVVDSHEIVPLEWFAGFQPLLLTLPEGKWMKTMHWLALRDHRRQVRKGRDERVVCLKAIDHFLGAILTFHIRKTTL